MYAKYFKRLMDLVVSVTALIVLFPLLLVLVITGAVVMKGNPFFLQPRPGKKGKDGREKIFYLVKLRTMSNARGADGRLLPDAQRLGKYGAWLRSSSLDELPSLVNIVLAHLSVVGPRPQLVRDMVFMTPEQRRRHSVRPGLTGLAQVNGRNNITWEQKFEYDLQYIDSGITFVGDMKIILQTVGKVLRRSDTVREGTVSDMDYGDWLVQEGKIDRVIYEKKQAEAEMILGNEVNIEGWIYYNHAVIPLTAPQKEADVSPVINGNIWKMKGNPLLARWTTNFDCGYETGWWYVIKDTPFDIAQLKSKRRYEIKRGMKYFEVKTINPCDYKEELYLVQIAAFSAYPKKYRPVVDKGSFLKDIDSWKENVVFGAFERESGELVGYGKLSKTEDCINFEVLKTNPEYEKYSLNAALVEKILAYYSGYLAGDGIICDGSRSINHETNFQDYLEKYFDFRKAYCHLHIVYNPKIKWLIRLLFLLRKVLLKMDRAGIVHQLNAILKMEEIVRSQNG